MLFLPDYGTILLLAAWPKLEREDLEPDDYKAIGKVIARIQRLLEEGKIRMSKDKLSSRGGGS